MTIDEGRKKPKIKKVEKLNKSIDMKIQKEKIVQEHIRKKNQFYS